jgi:hypothetical protein
VESLEEARSPEVSRRLAEILDPSRPLMAEQLRAVRSVEVLEWIGSLAARALLTSWAGGVAGATLTTEAKAALRRLPGP